MKKIIYWSLVIIWMAFIYSLSHQPASESKVLSKGVTEIVVENIEKVVPNKEINKNKLHNTVRKNAHFFTYLVLAVLVLKALRSSGMRGYPSIGIALLICLLYAISDELHQLVVPGRGAQISDVFLDFAGAIVGIVVYSACHHPKFVRFCR